MVVKTLWRSKPYPTALVITSTRKHYSGLAPSQWVSHHLQNLYNSDCNLFAPQMTMRYKVQSLFLIHFSAWSILNIERIGPQISSMGSWQRYELCVPQHGTGTREGKQGHKTCLEELSWVRQVSLAGVNPRVKNPICCQTASWEGTLQEKAWVETGTDTVRMIRIPAGNRISQAANACHMCSLCTKFYSKHFASCVLKKKNLWFPVMIMVPYTQTQKSLLVDTMSTLTSFFSFRRLTVLRNFFGEEFSNLLGMQYLFCIHLLIFWKTEPVKMANSLSIL